MRNFLEEKNEMNRRLVTIYTVYTVFMLATILYASPTSAQNLIQDGSFEDPCRPTPAAV